MVNPADKPVVVATRRSALALAQARAWMQHFRQVVGVQTEELHVVTTGDRVQDRALSEIGGKGLFIKEIEEAILAGRADCAVHSLKDVPAEVAPGLQLVCIPKRADARDAFKSRTGVSFESLPKGARIGTSSLRRVVQLGQRRPDVQFVALRGNVDTRLRKCDEGEVDAVILACAGLERLGLGHHITEILSPELCLPAVGQGALAIEIRENDTELRAQLSEVNDPETELLVAAERGVMLAVEGSCQVPVAGYALRELAHGVEQLWLRGFLAEADGSRVRRAEVRVPWPKDVARAAQVGLELGAQLRG
jgi:hydroxymethylbilane synthase